MINNYCQHLPLTEQLTRFCRCALFTPCDELRPNLEKWFPGRSITILERGTSVTIAVDEAEVTITRQRPVPAPPEHQPALKQSMSAKCTKALIDLNELEISNLMRAMGNQIQAVAVEQNVEKPMFVLLLFNDPKIAQYISNCRREDCIKALRETADRLERRQDVQR